MAKKVFVSGCYDLLHSGHVEFFRQAAQYGDLYVGIGSDNTTRPNGTPRKLLDVSKAAGLGWRYKTELEDGIRLAYKDFLEDPMRAGR